MVFQISRTPPPLGISGLVFIAMTSAWALEGQRGLGPACADRSQLGGKTTFALYGIFPIDSWCFKSFRGFSRPLRRWRFSEEEDWIVIENDMIYCADDGVLLYPLTFSSLTRGCLSKQLIVGSRVLISVSFLHVPSCVTSHSSLHSFRTTKIMK